MPHNVESLILILRRIPEDECKHIALNCPWTTTSKDESLTVIISCLKWTCNHGFCLRVTAHRQGTQNVSKQMDLDDHHPLLRSLTDALNLYEVFPEPHRKNHQFEILGEIIEYLDLESY